MAQLNRSLKVQRVTHHTPPPFLETLRPPPPSPNMHLIVSELTPMHYTSHRPSYPDADAPSVHELLWLALTFSASFIFTHYSSSNFTLSSSAFYIHFWWKAKPPLLLNLFPYPLNHRPYSRLLPVLSSSPAFHLFWFYSLHNMRPLALSICC